ncbi:hypothetical protein DCC81_12175 [Chitinophaga parva]|uniref:Uncharacterized protein n=1 Tax=Chitinophaga parva TaxID=2169414 RepID=A0A2T7BFR3_9BACT|nr:hypothetical protein [Chitinophaga parva]PUZ25063.1 hypothetical protein DCC81_12175 [Chitinophaga parva]
MAARVASGSFWQKLFPPITREPVLTFLAAHRITMSDTIRTCDRIFNTALDAHLIPRAYNLELVDQLRNSQIEHIFFTTSVDTIAESFKKMDHAH